MDERDDALDILVDMPSIALIGTAAACNIAEQIRTIRDLYERPDQIDASRFALRAIAAIMPPGQDDAYTIAQIAGFSLHQANDFFSALAATGPWSGEVGFEKLRAFLTATIAIGEHPADVAAEIGMPEDEYQTYNILLGLEQHWADTIPDRIFIAVHTGGTDAEIRKIAR